MRLFPVLLGAGSYATQVYVPWHLIASHAAQADRNHGQTLERLAERGGLSPCELAAVLLNRPWQRMTDNEAWCIIFTEAAAVSVTPR